MAPAKGCPRPHTMFWMAIARAKTSGDQLRPSTMGVAKRPKLVLKPYVIRAIRHPHPTTNATDPIHSEDRPFKLFNPSFGTRPAPPYTYWNDRSNILMSGGGGS